MQIDKYTPLPEKIKTELAKTSNPDLNVGNVYIKTDSYNARIVRVTKIWESTEIFNKQKSKDIKVKYQEAKDWEATEWGEEKTERLSYFEYNFLSSATKVDSKKSIKEYLQEAKDLMDGKLDTSIYEDSSTDNINDENAVMNKNSKQGLMVLQEHLEEKKSRAEIIKAFVSYEMKRRMAELDKIKEKLKGVLAVYQKKIARIMRVITTIELYLGIDEDLFQIQEGEPASPEEPIQFRQMVLFMDEEMGIWKDGGLDFTNIEWFDEWLVKDDNFKRLIPEKKGMVVFRPRRYDKEYKGYDPILAATYNLANRSTYLLIRNGDNLYRIYTEKILISPRLFPKRKELEKLIHEVNEEIEKSKGWSNEDERVEEAKDKVDSMMYQYKKRAALMQGLIDRTDIFLPMAKHISIFKMEESEGLINFIYDDEATLPSGRIPFKDWWKDINSKIEKGSRILMTGEYSYKRNEYADRFYLAKQHWDGLRNVPDLPNEGVYIVEEFTSSNSRHYKETEYLDAIKSMTEAGIKFKDEGVVSGKHWRSPDEATGNKTVYSIKTFEEESNLTIMYMPKKEASGGWNSWDTHERKSRTRFKIFNDDEFVMNYDQISLDDINFYLTSRVDRPNYLHMMPLLEKIKVHLLEEETKETDFIKLIAGRTNCDINEVRVAVDWWKFKNQWKRPIEKDNTLALRMIEKKLLKNK